jgi:hypothetical protein
VPAAPAAATASPAAATPAAANPSAAPANLTRHRRAFSESSHGEGGPSGSNNDQLSSMTAALKTLKFGGKYKRKSRKSRKPRKSRNTRKTRKTHK